MKRLARSIATPALLYGMLGILPKNTTQRIDRRPGLKPGPLDLESDPITTRPPRLPQIYKDRRSYRIIMTESGTTAASRHSLLGCER